MQSREYKYDRQVFDQKAQSMTEKYAKAGTSENSSSLTMQTNTTASTVLTLNLIWILC